MPPTVNRAADSHEIRPLTGLRAVAAALVVCFHFELPWMTLFPALGIAAPLIERGYLGVDLFFILSGFILSYVYRAGETAYSLTQHRKFLWLRLARIYPNHLATLAILVIYVLAARWLHLKLPHDYPWKGLPFQLTLTQRWPLAPGGLWNFPSWSISVEWFAYLFMFPLCWRMLRRGGSGNFYLGAGYAFLLAELISLLAIGHLHSFEPTLRASLEFVAGSLFFGAYWQHGWFNPFCQRWATAAMGLILLLMALPEYRFAPFFTVLLFPVLLVGLTAEKSAIAKLLATPLLLWLGRISYAIYMSHALALTLLAALLPHKHFASASLPVRLSVLLVDVALILLMAVALYYLVEIPSRNLLRRATRRRDQRRAANAPMPAN